MVYKKATKEVNEMNKGLAFAVFAVFILLGTVMFAISTADNPKFPKDVFEISSERLPAYGSESNEAQAGNITKMNITAWSQTQTWAGYVGNVTGRIVLDDANNNSLYDWRANEPQGEVYAVNSSVSPTWANIRCFEFNNGTMGLNRSIYETDLGLDSDDYDGVDETFNDTNHSTFYVGTYTIPENTCPSTWMYVNDADQQDTFREVLLTDKTNVIYTAIIEDDDANTHGGKTGFDGNNYDYQMLVGVNGHNGSDATWEYFFYVELE